MAAAREGQAFSLDSILGVGALSELVTSALCLRLSEKGDLRLEQSIGSLLGELERVPVLDGNSPVEPPPWLSTLSLGRIIGNSSGSDTRFFLSLSEYRPLDEPERLLHAISFSRPPLEAAADGSALFDLLGAGLARREGLAFEELAKREIFLPLGMRSSDFRHRPSSRDADLRYKSGPPGSYPTRIPAFTELPVPSGSLRTSLRELSRFFSSILHSARRGGGLLPREEAAWLLGLEAAIEEPNRLWLEPGEELARLGLVRWRWGKLLSHRALVAILPEEGLGVLVMANSWNIIATDRILPLAASILEAASFAGDAATRIPTGIDPSRRFRP